MTKAVTSPLPALPGENRCVLQVLPALNDGGVEQSALEMALFLKAHGWRPVVASHGGTKETRLLQGGVMHVRVPLQKKGPIALLCNAVRLVGIIRREKPVLVHARSRGPAWSAWLACRWTGVPYITTFHGTYGVRGGWLKRFYNSVMLRGPIVIANSAFTAKHIVETYGFDKRRIVVAPRGVDPNVWDTALFDKKTKHDVRRELGVEENVPLLMMVGRLTGWKGHELVLHALATMQDVPWVLAVVGGAGPGDEAYATHLKALAEELGIGGRVRWLGSRQDVPRLMAAAAVAISGSIKPEAFGRVALEAMAMGVPVVATALGGSLETLQDNKTGWLVRPGGGRGGRMFGESFGVFEPQAMAEKLRKALLKSTDLQTMGQAARAHVLAHYTVDQCCAKELQGYMRVLGLPHR